MDFELGIQMAVGFCGPSKCDDPAGVAIQAVDDPQLTELLD